MRFNFDIAETNNDEKEQKSKTLIPYSSPSSSTPKDKLQWLPLQDHPVFSSSAGEFSGVGKSSENRFPANLMAWDGASRIFFWDSEKHFLHRISVRLGDPEPTSVLAAFPSKVYFLSLLFSCLSWVIVEFWYFVLCFWLLLCRKRLGFMEFGV